MEKRKLGEKEKEAKKILLSLQFFVCVWYLVYKNFTSHAFVKWKGRFYIFMVEVKCKVEAKLKCEQ